MRRPKVTNRFKKDYAHMSKSGRRDIEKLDTIMNALSKKEILSPIHKDHPLQGEWKSYRECHIEGDWLLIYKLEKDEKGEEVIIFIATDSHSNLFG